MNKLSLPVLACLALLAVPSKFAQADSGPAVMASIKPVHSLVAGVMEGVGRPGLLVEGAASPHTYALKPSQVRALSEAKLVFWVGQNLESFLAKPLDNISKDARPVALSDSAGVTHYEYRELDDLDGDAHGGHEGHKHDDHQKEAGKKDHDHGHSHDHAGQDDPHIWLDPRNAAAMVDAIEAALAETDPANAAAYKANADRLRQRLGELEARIAAAIEPVQNRRFAVFHDAYQYFERRFGLEASAAVTLSPETSPGAEHVSEVSKRIRDLKIACVFTEPQFEPKLVRVVTEGTNARTAELDPLGATLPDGPDLYFELLDGMTRSMTGCLSGSS
jgi:zinc transport system substrate-binding protein